MAKKTTKTAEKYNVCIEESLNGTPILNLEPDVERFGLKMGARKLAIVLEHIDDVRLFLKRNPYAPRIRIAMTEEQKELWKRAKKVLKTGLVDVVRIKQALLKGGFTEQMANDLLDREVTSNRTKAESLLGV